MVLGPKSSEIDERQTTNAFSSATREAFLDKVEHAFGVTLQRQERTRVDHMDDLMAIIRAHHVANHGTHLNSHHVWGKLNRLANALTGK